MLCLKLCRMCSPVQCQGENVNLFWYTAYVAHYMQMNTTTTQRLENYLYIADENLILGRQSDSRAENYKVLKVA